LVLIVLALLAIGLVASDVATASSLRSYFLDRVDQGLDTTGAFTARLFALGSPSGRPLASLPRNVKLPPRDAADVQAARISPDGHVVRTLEGPFTSTSDAFSVLPPTSLARARHGATVRFDVTSKSGRYRAIAEPIAGSTDVAVVISPLRGVEATLIRLYWIEGIATAVLLLLAGVLALWLVRVGLRPLVHIADTADAVAAGEVDRRVDVRGGYEVARLGRALNSAFDARAASEQTLREFISDASHELRTPLTSIRGYAELLRAGALQGPEESARASARIEHEAARMGVLVDNLLSLARLDEGRPLELGEVDLTHLAVDAISDARAVESDRPISLIAPTPVNIVGDETTLRQVLANLLSNAREHTPPRTRVEVRVAQIPSGARLDIVDDGAGIGPDECIRVFDRFWRGTTSGGGSGLGLAIVAATAQAHGGRAWADPSDDRLRGAHFVVELPARPPS
jgi:two-component system OmpR family sensor kinase